MSGSKHVALLALAVAALALDAGAQTFTSNTTSIPQGAPFNNSTSESVNFEDVDQDGDFDAAFADGGDAGNDQNRLWINQGGAQGGTVGVFLDRTATQFPAVLDTSRDIEFADVDVDGDPDLYIANTAQISNQSSRWWINQGGSQGGSLGSYVDETSTRWTELGGAGSSVPASFVLPNGGFIDWSCFAAFGDLDADGDLDLFHSSYGSAFVGNVPSRVFVNDGAGFFEEFNPSGFQLAGSAIPNGAPGLWCEGTQQYDTADSTGMFCDIATSSLAVDLGDLDGDFDLDVVLGARDGLPRLFRNRLEENGGTPSFRDVTTAWFPPLWATGNGHYEQELGDLDEDGDLDLYGINWLQATSDYSDVTLKNDGQGKFAAPVAIAGTQSDDQEAELIDYDGDGDLDVFVAAYAGPNKMVANSGPSGGHTFSVVSGVLPTTSHRSIAAAACDVELDGDQDLFTADDAHFPNLFLENHTDVVDAIAPRIFKVEQAPARQPGADTTPIRALIYDNESFYMTAQQAQELVYTVDGGLENVAPMRWSGGNVFRGELPGSVVGDICYRVRSTDFHGNQSESPPRCFHSGAGTVAVYCTSKVNSRGCYPQMHFTGAPSTVSASGFTVRANKVLNNKFGLFFYSLAGKQGLAFQGGFLCVKAPTKRTALLHSGGNPPPNDCSGTYALDFNAYAAGGADPAVQVPGAIVRGQWWQRDPGFPAPNNTGLTEAIEFTMQ
jgi:hypothetical protein